MILALYLLSLAWNPFSHDKEVLDWKKEQDKLKKSKTDEITPSAYLLI